MVGWLAKIDEKIITQLYVRAAVLTHISFAFRRENRADFVVPPTSHWES
jgi:hypothetical protein